MSNLEEHRQYWLDKIVENPEVLTKQVIDFLDINCSDRQCDEILKEDLIEKFFVDKLNQNINRIIPSEDFDIKFDWENFLYEGRNSKNLMGPQELEERVFIGCKAGGDWNILYFL